VHGISTIKRNLPTGDQIFRTKIFRRNAVKNTFRLLAACGLAIAMTATTWAANPKLSPELQAENGSDTIDIIVQYNQPPTETQHRRMASRGAALKHAYTAVWGSLYTARRSSLASIAEDPDVRYVTPNRPLKAMFDQITDGTVHSDYGNSIGQTGAGIGVAIIDSGIVDLPDFHTGSTDRIVYQQSFLGAGATPADQYACGGNSRGQRQWHSLRRNRAAGQHCQSSGAGWERPGHGRQRDFRD
jgi:hypothetical protein